MSTLSLADVEKNNLDTKLQLNQRNYRIVSVFIFGFVRNLNKTENSISFYAVFTYRFCLEKEYRGFYYGNIQVKTFRGILKDNFIIGSYNEYPGGW